MQTRIGLVWIIGEIVMVFPWKSDLRIFRTFREWVSRGELGPEIRLGLL